MENKFKVGKKGIPILDGVFHTFDKRNINTRIYDSEIYRNEFDELILRIQLYAIESIDKKISELLNSQ